MKFLIDNAISPYVAKGLVKLGHDAIHVRDIGLQDASDTTIFSHAAKEDRIIVSADTDFGYLLSKWNKSKPSFIIFRKGSQRDPEIQVELLKANLSNDLLKVLSKGAILVFETNRIRIRKLPIFPSSTP